MACAAPDLPSTTTAVLAATQAEEKKSSPGRPQEQKGEEEGGRGEEAEPDRKPPPQSPTNGEKKNSLICIIKPHENAHPDPTKTHPTKITELMAPNPSQKRAVTKIELRKTRLRKGELFVAVFGMQKQGHFRARNLSRKTPDSISRVHCQKPSRKKPKTDRTLKKPKIGGKVSVKNPRKKRAALPLKHIEILTDPCRRVSGSAFHISVPIRFLIPHISASVWDPSQSGPRRPSKQETEREREKTWGKKRVCEPGGDATVAPAKMKRLLGPCGPKRRLATKKSQTGGGLNPSAREGQSTPCPHSGKGSGRDHPRAGLPASRCNAP